MNCIELDIPVKTHGRYLTQTGYPKGLVIHFTAGRSLNGRQDAQNTMKQLSDDGYGCMVMDKDGVIYKPRNQHYGDVSYHAGASHWLGETNLSFKCLGLEICCAGEIDRDGKSWFGEFYQDELLRRVTDPRDNYRPGFWHKFTDKQEASLKEFVLYLSKMDKLFDLDWVVGHDEIAQPLGRKSDPGACLSMTMPEFRSMLKRERFAHNV